MNHKVHQKAFDMAVKAALHHVTEIRRIGRTKRDATSAPIDVRRLLSLDRRGITEIGQQRNSSLITLTYFRDFFYLSAALPSFKHNRRAS